MRWLHNKDTNSQDSKKQLQAQQNPDELDTMDLRDVSDGYIIKVTKSKLNNSVRTLHFHFTYRPRNTSDTSSLMALS